MLRNEHTVSDASSLTGWHKSSYSGGGQSNCLEVAPGHPTIPVRDSKNTSGPALLFSVDSWTAFLGALKG
ncbi:DUF397 domain-containing protein [Streptomyces murinus]|uniref:DUF397 domain-containing protein n=1 Tax=Streptomyces murinus TaxID=33900 RepID=A0A7W3NNE7_STRMR|nr:DUF397 domain-containing protein [Streptomyces murinus]MBA9053749.1 hypothetical protein [Streptomyces murinus]UWW94843.1 DUF397 domain-containing protein [Streptomyces murinus]